MNKKSKVAGLIIVAAATALPIVPLLAQSTAHPVPTVDVHALEKMKGPKVPANATKLGKQEPVGPAQPDLWLDRIKPVRNDLSDSDIEVIPAATPAASGPAMPESESKSIPLEPAPVEARWSGIRRQFRDAGKT